MAITTASLVSVWSKWKEARWNDVLLRHGVPGEKPEHRRTVRRFLRGLGVSSGALHGIGKHEGEYYRFPICIISLGPEMFDAADADG